MFANLPSEKVTGKKIKGKASEKELCFFINDWGETFQENKSCLSNIHGKKKY